MAASFLDKLRSSKGPQVALGAALYLLRREVQEYTRALAEGQMLAFQFEQGTSAEEPALIKERFEKLHADWQQLIISPEREHFDQKALMDGMVARYEELIADNSKNAEAKLAEQEEKFVALLARSEADLAALKKTVDVDLATKAPVKYWSQKRQEHNRQARRLQRWICAYTVFGFVMLSWAASNLLNVELGGVHTLPLWHVLGFSTFVALLVWGARVLVRLMLSNVHLASDAWERSVIAPSYLALVRRGAFEADTVNKVLEALLRHSPDGIVRDDALPYLADMLKKDS